MTEIHLDDGFAAKDIDENFQLHMIDVDVVDDASEVGKWAFLHAYALADFVFEFWLLALWRSLAVALCREEGFHFTSRQWSWLLTFVALPDETRNAGSVANAEP